jgi:hypothetical protein
VSASDLAVARLGPVEPLPAYDAARRAFATRRIADAIRGCRFRYHDEDGLQRGIAAALEGAQWPVEREVRLDSRSRIDLLVDVQLPRGSIHVGVEAKIASSPAAVLRQVRRYLDSDRIDGLVLVTTRVRHLAVATTSDKPLEVVSLVEGGL